MTADEAVTFVELSLKERSLTRVEQSVFLGVWQGLSYSEIAKQTGYDAGYIKLVSHKLWHLLTETFGEKVTKSTVQNLIRRQIQKQLADSSTTAPNLQASGNSHQDWCEVIDVAFFYGRGHELEILEKWIDRDRCRLVAILGMGGLGKTALSVKLAQQLQDKFDFVVWRSLNNAKTPSEMLSAVIHFLSQQKETPDTTDTNALISRLMEYLQRYRCLLVLDNFESVLKDEAQAGAYRKDYEGYGSLLRRVGEVSHRSCVVITSREMPEEVATLEGDILPVRALQLTGLDEPAAERVLEAKGIKAISDDLHRLVDWYRGNPLALKIAATSIKDLYSGSINRFLEQKTIIFSGIGNLIEQQYQRLTAHEKQIMIWLAINREPVQPNELRSDIVPTIEQNHLMMSLRSLKRRSLVEHTAAGFTQQPVVMEFVTNLLIEQIYQEITQEHPLGALPSIQLKLNRQLFYLRHYALIKATAKDYIRQSQIRLILEPLVTKLLGRLGSKQMVAKELFQTLEELRRRELRPEGELKSTFGYGGGNIINLLCNLGIDLTGKDFSYLAIRQAYLSEVKLHRVNFAQTAVIKSVFAEVIGGVLSVAFSANGKLLAIGDTKGDIHLWQVSDGKPILTYRGHKGWVVSVAFNPEGTVLASSSVDQSIKLWDVSTGDCLNTLQGYIGAVMSVAFSPDGTTLASGHADRTVRLWKSGQCLKILHGHEDIVEAVAFSSKGNLLASSSDDCTVRLWDIDTGECSQIFEGHEDIIWSIAFSHNGNVLASGSEDKTIRLWNTDKGNCIKTLAGHTHTVFAVSFSHDGSTLATGSGDRTIRLWDLKTAQCSKTLTGHNHWVRSVAFHPDRLVLASSSGDEMVKLWEIDTGFCMRTFQGHTGRSWTTKNDNQGDSQASGNISNEHLLNLWEVTSGQQFRILQGYTNAVRSVVFNLEQTILASGGDDSIIRLWDIQSGECIRALHGHAGHVWQVAFSPIGTILASCAEDCTIKLWDVSSGNCLTTISEHPDLARTLVFSHDGKLLATGETSRVIKLRDIVTGECLRILQGHKSAILAIAFSDDDHYLISSSRDKTVKIWDTKTGDCLQTLETLTSITSNIKFMPMHPHIAFGCGDKFIYRWNIKNGDLISERLGHDGNVLTIAADPKGVLLASAGEDAQINIWNWQTGEAIRALAGHIGTVYSVSFSADGNLIASSSRDETVKLWDVQTGECIRTYREPRPYEGLNITEATGLTSAQKAKLIALGAIEE
ncbi:NB-ARC domain-containing protein [Pseudanabaena galeata UHCC 0370]|jgi:WD40 repeat protein|uniref:NB-ARC domain-containing protein n=1 Tax=Pseudanabaena galeata UHCC 0370 TaxID=3110310 RepID=A0ABU5TE81_9CYAN|nr:MULTISPECIES: NB-ARC domain-containing protein [Pseudanabaena]MEA5476574.1 NB-ARC domain-containing protein [Pseudanabaena galeata UHCC 0370]MEA5489317.1 NB-ARC domain-containing protein [Pseudanabaena sp. CCNP1317]WGS74114.1 NB-ARC domain-containing protein [Pseudanabaena galeata CCNP1313]